MRVLVLCHGSVNRSPFVAGLIRKLRPDWEVRVAGLKTKAGRSATKKAKTAALDRGFDLSAHKSVCATADLVQWSQITLYMDGGNEKRLRELVGEKLFGSRARLLATYGSLRRVPDPNYTSDPEKLAEMFAAAELCTEKFLETHP